MVNETSFANFFHHMHKYIFNCCLVNHLFTALSFLASSDQYHVNFGNVLFCITTEQLDKYNTLIIANNIFFIIKDFYF